MPGIVGIVRPNSPEGYDEESVREMIVPLLHQNWYKCSISTTKGAAMGIVSLGTIPYAQTCLESGDGRYLLAFEGEIYNVDEIHDEVTQKTRKELSPRDVRNLILHALIEWGADALDRFNGLFQLVFWDAREQELILAGDRGGLRPLFFNRGDGAVVFATEVKALLNLPWVSREIGHRGILDFLEFGQTVDNHTFFQHIKRLPGGHYLALRNGQVDIKRYWGPRFDEHVDMTEEEAKDQFVQVWDEVMQSQGQGDYRFGSLLSGGIDSRLILSSLVSRQRSIPTFTIGAPSCEDAKIARQISNSLACPNLFSPVTSNDVMRGLDKLVFLTDGMFNCFHANIRYLIPSLVDMVDYVFDGISTIDSVYNAIEVPFIRHRCRKEPLWWARRAYGGTDLQNYPAGYKSTINLLTGDLRHIEKRDYLELFYRRNQSRAGGPIALGDLFNAEERQPKFISHGPNIIRSVVEVRCPFFDKRMLEFSARLSPRFRTEEKTLFKHALLLKAPQLSKIPWQRTGLPVNAGTVRYHFKLGAKFLGEYSKRVMQTYFGKAGTRAAKKSMIDFDYYIRSSSELRDQIMSYLVADAPAGSGLFDPQSVKSLVDHHVRGSGEHAEMVGRLLTVELWHREFVKGSLYSSKAPTIRSSALAASSRDPGLDT